MVHCKNLHNRRTTHDIDFLRQLAPPTSRGQRANIFLDTRYQWQNLPVTMIPKLPNPWYPA